MTLKNFKKIIVDKFDKTIKAATTRAVPIVQKEAAKVMKSSSTKAMGQIVDVVKITLIGGVITYSYLSNGGSFHKVPIIGPEQSISIKIENLTINL